MATFWRTSTFNRDGKSAQGGPPRGPFHYIYQHVQSCGVHCKDAIPKIRNKYSQKRNCAASVPNFHIHVYVSDLYIPRLVSYSAAR
jgi:hypothetical protein